MAAYPQTGTVSVHSQPAFLNLASGSVVNCEFLRPKCGPLHPHLTTEMIFEQWLTPTSLE